MAQVKIGEREYKLESLTAYDLNKLDKEKKEKTLSDYEYAFYVILHGIKKFNPEIKMTLDEFMDTFPVVGIKDKLKELEEITGVNFTQGDAGTK